QTGCQSRIDVQDADEARLAGAVGDLLPVAPTAGLLLRVNELLDLAGQAVVLQPHPRQVLLGAKAAHRQALAAQVVDSAHAVVGQQPVRPGVGDPTDSYPRSALGGLDL